MYFTHFFKDFQVFFCYSTDMRYFFRLILFIFSLSVLSLNGHASLSLKEIQNEIKNVLDRSYEGKSPLLKTLSTDSQLLSCQTGIKETRSLIAGLHLKSKPGWVIKNPTVTARADNYTTTVLKQVREDLPMTEKWTETYNTPIVFPILLEGTPEKDITLNVNAAWTACPKDYKADSDCSSEQQVYSIPLSMADNYSTVYCAYLSRALRTAAIDIKRTDIKIQNKLLPNGNLILRFIFPNKNDVVEFQTENSRQLVAETIQPAGKVWQFVLKTDTPFFVGEEIPLLIRTTNGCYYATIQVADYPLSFSKKELSVWSGFWLGLFFFVMSPIWCYWLAPHKLTLKTKKLIPAIKRIQIGYAVGLLFWGVLWFLNVPIYAWTNFVVLDWLILILGFYLLFKPFQPVWMIGLLTVLLPKPFWDFIEYVSLPAKIGLLIWFLLFPYLMFNIWKMSPKETLSVFKKFQKADTPAYHIFVRMPYIILVIWLGLVLICLPKTFDISDIQKKKDGLVIVQVSPPLSLSALKDRFFIFSSLKGVPVYRIKSNNEWVRQKKTDYALNEEKFNILITANNQEIILPDNLSVHLLKQIIRRYY